MSRMLKLTVVGLVTLLIVACRDSEERMHTGQMKLSDGRIFTCTMKFPASWDGKYEVREAGSIIWFDYSENQEMKQPLFSLTALTMTEWARARQEPGHGQLLVQQDGAVFVYNVALENLYSGSHAEEFQRMAGDVQSTVATLEVTEVK